MAAPKKNKFWKARTKHGRDKIFSDPNILWTAACEYFQWCDNNPLKEEKVFGTGHSATVDLMRAYTLRGLLFFLDIDENTWQRYRKDEPYKDFWAVIERVDSVIYTQKFEGAAAGLLNANIIARELGLVDKKDMTSDGESMNKGFGDFLKSVNKINNG